MPSEIELGMPGEMPKELDVPGSADEVKDIRPPKPSRHVSIDVSPSTLEKLRASPPLPFLAAQKKRRSGSSTMKRHPEERVSSETISSRISSPSTSSVGAVAGSTVNPPEPQTSNNKNGKDAERLHVHTNDDHLFSNEKERPRRAGHRRTSPRMRRSITGPPGNLDFMADEFQEDIRSPSRHHLLGPGSRFPDEGQFRNRSPSHPLPGDLSIDGAIDGRFAPPMAPQPPTFPNGFGSPEMPFSPAEPVFSPVHPSFPVKPPTPNYQLSGLPLSGYELLAAKLSGAMAGPRISPIYRRFESLHHRLLLHMQDELVELEEELHNLDGADTQNRRYPGGIYPASRRSEAANPTEGTWKKKEIMGQIAQKLYQYNQVISSYKETQGLAEPGVGEVFGYKSYLNAVSPVVEDEAQFLEASDDLVNLAKRRRRSAENHSDDPLTPMPYRLASMFGFPPSPSSRDSDVGNPRSSKKGSSSRQIVLGFNIPKLKLTPLLYLVLAMAMVVLAPLLCFFVIPGFVGRMTVVLLVGLGGAAAVIQSGYFTAFIKQRTLVDWVVVSGVYGAVMAVIAGTVA